MSRTTILLLAVLALAMPAKAMAQTSQPDQRAANEYNPEEDEQPMKLISYFFQPVGFLLEWTVTRPLHYIAAESPAAPAFKGTSEGYYDSSVGKVQPLPPPDKFPPENNAVPEAQNDASSTTSKAVKAKRAPTEETLPPTQVSPGESQPVLH